MSNTPSPAMEFVKKIPGYVKTGFTNLKEQGFFNYCHVFAVELLKPLRTAVDFPEAKQICLGQSTDIDGAFLFCNGMTFWMEVLASFLALWFGEVVFKLIMDIALAYIFAYSLYWLVVYSGKVFYIRLAIGLYVVYTLLNATKVIGSLVFVLPAAFYAVKTVACLLCGFYAYKIHAKAQPESVPQSVAGQML